MKNNSYLLEAFILGSLIFWGLTCVDIQVTVNVTDKPIISNHKDAEVKNITRDEK